MTDSVDPSSKPGPGRIDPLQIAFWAAVVLGVGAAGVAMTAGPAVGQAGAILLILLAGAGLVLFFWMSRGAGRAHGAFPERGALEAAAMQSNRNEHMVVDALDEAALVTDKNLSPLAANGAYYGIAEAAGALGESDRPPMLNRLFGADPMLSAPMFRLSKAAGQGQARREQLPATALFGPEAKPVRYEASVGPMAGGRVLWRLRELGAGETPSEEDRKLFLDDAPIGFFAARADGTVVYMNRSLRAVLGIGDDPSPLRVRDLIKEDVARVLRRDRRGFGPSRTKITLRARDGAETLASSITFWPEEEGDGAARTLVFFADAEAPEENAPSRVFNLGGSIEPDGVFAQAPFGAAVLDCADPAAATLLDSNAALMEMTQGRAAPGVALVDLFDASEGPAALSHRLRKAINDPTEFMLATKPPTAAHVHFARSADGRGLAYIVNVSEQRELETRLAQSEKMREIGELAAGVAHDFNNLLTVVMQTCSYLLRRHPVGDADYPLLKEITDHATSARELSEMLRAYARQQTFAREVFDVGDFLGPRQALFKRIIGDSIPYELKHGRDLPFVKVDKAQLERVLVNLATNARDAMNSKGGRDAKLIMRTSVATAEEARAMGHNPIEDGRYALIEVEDTGAGIKAEHAAKIFRPYHSTKEAGKGTGLGLATSYGIIKQSGGYIFFTSKIGQGTTFRIFLPEYQPTGEELNEIAEKERAILAPPSKDVAGRGKILFVEDQEGVRRSIVRNLKDCGYEVMEAENGEDALEILQNNHGAFDMIISDVSMPIMTGPEMLQQTDAAMLGKAKVLFLSGYAPESFSDMLEAYPVSYMSKPVTMEQLVSRVKELLAA